MQDLNTIRCSALPEAFLCPGSVRPAKVLIDPINPAGKEGVAAHKVMELLTTGDVAMRDLDLDEIAERYAVNAEDLARLAWRGLKCWREPDPQGVSLREAFRGARAEVRLVTHVAGVELTGTMDLLALYPAQRLARVADWKSGRVDRDYSAQVFGYGVLVLMNHPDIDTVDVSVVWMREAEIEPYRITRADLGAWVERLRAGVIAWDRVYRPGRQCEHCARSHDCEALIAQGTRDLALLRGFAVEIGDALPAAVDQRIMDMEPEALAAIHRRAQTMARFCESFHQLVKHEVIRRGGSMEAGDGKLLAIKSTFNRDVDPMRAWDVLHSMLTEQELAQAIRVRLGEAEEIIAKKAGKGNGAAAKRALNKALEDAEAIQLVEVRQLREVRKP